MNSEEVPVQGIVLSASDLGENDRRLVLLTKELGKVTAFAHGARRPKSPFVAAANPFSQGRFILYPGKNAYTLRKAEIDNYFRELSEDVERFAYGSYFLELASYVSQENLEAPEELGLLFYSLKALLSDRFENALVRRVFEMRTFVIDGAYPDYFRAELSDTARYTLDFITRTELKKLYSFRIDETIVEEIGRVIDRFMKANIPKEFQSLKLLS